MPSVYLLLLTIQLAPRLSRPSSLSQLESAKSCKVPTITLVAGLVWAVRGSEIRHPTGFSRHSGPAWADQTGATCRLIDGSVMPQLAFAIPAPMRATYEKPSRPHPRFSVDRLNFRVPKS
jgi:hypothetical protein